MDLLNIELERLLDEIHVALTYVDRHGNILYRNRADAERPSPGARDVGVNIKDCHAFPKSMSKIKQIFHDFVKGDQEPYCYVTQRLGGQDLVTLVPIFKEGDFDGCMSVIHNLERKEIEKSA